MNFRFGKTEAAARAVVKSIESTSRETSQVHVRMTSRADYLRTIEVLHEKWERDDRELRAQVNIELLLEDRPRVA